MNLGLCFEVMTQSHKVSVPTGGCDHFHLLWIGHSCVYYIKEIKSIQSLIKTTPSSPTLGFLREDYPEQPPLGVSSKTTLS